MRHRGQINEVEVDLPKSSLGADDLAALEEAFFSRYEALYGKGSSFRGARLELVNLRCRARAATPRPAIRDVGTANVDAPQKAMRSVYWTDAAARRDTPVFDGDAMHPGAEIVGPAIVETRDTTVVIHPGQRLKADGWGNFTLDA